MQTVSFCFTFRLPFYQYPEVCRFSSNRQILVVITLSEADNTKLRRIKPMQERDWNTHQPFVIHWYVLRSIHIDGVAVVKTGILSFVAGICSHKRNELVARRKIKVRQPHAIVGRNDSLASLVHPRLQSIKFIMIRDSKPRNTASHVHSHPGLVLLYETEYLLVGYCVDVPYNKKFFPVCHKQ